MTCRRLRRLLLPLPRPRPLPLPLPLRHIPATWPSFDLAHKLSEQLLAGKRASESGSVSSFQASTRQLSACSCISQPLGAPLMPTKFSHSIARATFSQDHAPEPPPPPPSLIQSHPLQSASYLASVLHAHTSFVARTTSLVCLSPAAAAAAAPFRGSFVQGSVYKLYFLIVVAALGDTFIHSIWVCECLFARSMGEACISD